MNSRQTLTLLSLGLTAGLFVSCASRPPSVASAAPALVWPPPPSEARITFVGNLRGPRDVGQNPSVFRTMANWVTGDSGENLNLQRPFAVAVDEKGNLCIADMGNHTICFANFVEKKWSRFAKVEKTKFSSPVAVAKRHGIFYVADSELGKVFAFRENGKSVFEISAPLKRPVGLAVTDESLFVVDSEEHAIFAFGLNGDFQFNFGRRGTGTGEFNFPTCIATDNRGHLLVTDTLNCRVQVFDLHGNFISQFGSNGDTSGHFARPKGIAVDAESHSYVVDAVFNNFQIFDAEGKLLLNVGEGGTGNGEFSLPNGIAIGADNRIYVADAFNRRVQILKYLPQP